MLLQVVTMFPCFRITSMDYVPAYHYELQTFAEKRETNWVCGPHKVSCGWWSGRSTHL